VRVTERYAGDITFLDVEGRILFGDGEEEFKDAVNRVIESSRYKLIINMAEVPFIDSAGISQLVRTFVTLGKRGGGMRLLNLSKRVTELLTVTRLLSVWGSYDSEEQAVASFGPPNA
jgi:anti-sigma B factor antagonist